MVASFQVSAASTDLKVTGEIIQGVSTLTMDFNVQATLQPRNTLDTTPGLNLDGSATIEMLYI